MAIWKAEKPTPKEILDALQGAGTKPDAVAALTRLGLTEKQADDAIEIIGSAKSRALLLSSGMASQQFHGDFEGDPLFREALRRTGPVVDIAPVSWRAYAFVILGACILLALGIALCSRN